MRRLVLCGVLGACAGDASLPAPDQIEQEIADRGATVVLVTLRPTPGKPGAGAFADTLDGVHAQARRSFRSFPGAVVRVDAAGYRALRGRADIVTIEPDQRVTGQLMQSVPLIHADQTQADGNAGTGVAVAILDSGLRASHTDFPGASLGPGQHFLDQGANAGSGAVDDQGHGSNVAGIVAGRGVAGEIGTGVAPAARIVPVKVLDNQNRGFASDWVAGLDWVVDNQNAFGVPIRVVNMSLGTDSRTASCPCDSDPQAAMRNAVAAARAAGILVVASSGNQGDTSELPYPACFSTVLPVAATYDASFGLSDVFGCQEHSSAHLLTCFSNRNACVALAAPGAAITSAYNTSDIATSTFFGTSQAAPHVAGMAAVIWGKYPELTVDQVEHALLTSTTTVNDPSLPQTYAFLDAVDSLAAAECDSGCEAQSVCESAACNASGLCVHSPMSPGSACGPTTCADANLTVPTCNDAGDCADVTTSCGMYACNTDGNQCLTRCVLPSDCAQGARCESRACVMAESDGGGCQTSRGEPSFATLLLVTFLLWRFPWTRSSRRSSVPAVRNR